MDYKAILAAAAILIGILSYIPYFRDIFRSRTKPHAFSWLIWGLIQLIAFFAQIWNGGGAGSWFTGVVALICLAVFAIALKKGEKTKTKFDWTCLLLALIGIALWAITKNPLTAVILVSLADTVGFLPTYRKAYHKPYEETLFTFFISAVTFAMSFFALQVVSWTTALYPIVLTLTNGVFVALVLYRRHVLQTRHKAL